MEKDADGSYCLHGYTTVTDISQSFSLLKHLFFNGYNGYNGYNVISRVVTMRPFLSNSDRLGLDPFIWWKYVNKTSFGVILAKTVSPTLEKPF